MACLSGNQVASEVRQHSFFKHRVFPRYCYIEESRKNSMAHLSRAPDHPVVFFHEMDEERQSVYTLAIKRWEEHR